MITSIFVPQRQQKEKTALLVTRVTREGRDLGVARRPVWRNTGLDGSGFVLREVRNFALSRPKFSPWIRPVAFSQRHVAGWLGRVDSSARLPPHSHREITTSTAVLSGFWVCWSEQESQDSRSVTNTCVCHGHICGQNKDWSHLACVLIGQRCQQW